MVKKLIETIEFRKDLYPRFEPNLKTIQVYSENVEKLPPIDINQNNILIDGWHRIKAHRQAGLKEIECNIIHTKSEEEIFLLAVEKNATHGLQLSQEDKKSLTIKWCGVFPQEKICKTLSISERTYRGWTANKRKELDEERNEKILDLWLKCWTQERIAQEIDESQQTVSNVIDGFTKNGKIAEISKDFQPFIYNIWNVTKNNNELQHPGNIPQEFIENVIYYYTKPFDTIYDPFAGGGITAIASKKWYRRYYCSDINPQPAVEEFIKKWDITQGIPKDLPPPDLVFLDPPYWKQMQGQYTNKPTDLSNMNLEQFYEFFDKFFKELNKKIKENGYVALIIMGTQWKNELKYEDHAIKIYQLLEKHGFKFEQRIICPYSTQQYNAQQTEIAKNKKILLNLYRDLIIFKKNR